MGNNEVEMADQVKKLDSPKIPYPNYNNMLVISLGASHESSHNSTYETPEISKVANSSKS